MWLDITRSKDKTLNIDTTSETRPTMLGMGLFEA